MNGDSKMDLEETRRMRRNYRGRRYLACRATDELHQVIESLGDDDGSELPPPDGTLPTAPPEPVRRELQNMAANLLRLILLHNDGRVSPQRLHRY